MKPMHYTSVIRLNAEIIDIKGLISYWLGITNPSRLKEALDEIAVLKEKLASLRIERKALLDDL